MLLGLDGPRRSPCPQVLELAVLRIMTRFRGEERVRVAQLVGRALPCRNGPLAKISGVEPALDERLSTQGAAAENICFLLLFDQYHQRDVHADAVLNGSGEIVKGRHGAPRRSGAAGDRAAARNAGTLRRSCVAGHLD